MNPLYWSWDICNCDRLIVEYSCGPMFCRFQCCGSGMFIPDPNFFQRRSKVKRFRIRIKEFKNQKNCFWALGSMIWVVHPGSWFFTYPESGSATEAPPPPPHASPFSKLSLVLSLPVCRLSNLLTGKGCGGGGEKPNHRSARNPASL